MQVKWFRISTDPDRFYFQNLEFRPEREIFEAVKDVLIKNGYEITPIVQHAITDVYECRKNELTFDLLFSDDDCDADTLFYTETEEEKQAIMEMFEKA